MWGQRPRRCYDSMLVGYGCTIATGVCATLAQSGGLVHKDGTRMAHGVGVVFDKAHGMPTALEFVGNLLGNAAFKLEVVGRSTPGAAIEPAGSGNGFLRGHAKIDHAGNNGSLGLGLALATHCSVNKVGLAVFEQHGRVERVEGTLARLKVVDVLGIKRKEAAPVLQ